jgi:uncharacterized protein HemX
LGKQVEKLKAKQKADRINDPHGWAYEIEKRADQRSIVGALACFGVLILAANAWLVWQERDRIMQRLDQLERASRAEVSLPPEGYEIVN